MAHAENDSKGNEISERGRPESIAVNSWTNQGVYSNGDLAVSILPGTGRMIFDRYASDNAWVSLAPVSWMHQKAIAQDVKEVEA